MPDATHTTRPDDAPGAARPRHFIQQIIDEDIARGKWGEPGDRSVVATRFPPEPNGFLHIGHAKAILLNAGIAREYGGRFILRFDDTNPAAEEQAFVESIQRDIRWLVPDSYGPAWDGKAVFASDYFEWMHGLAVELIGAGHAYVDDQSPEEIREARGVPTRPGTPSPFRDRPVSESLDLFARMTAGEFAEGSRVLRAKIDMASPNMNLRDPVMYRILRKAHHRAGDRWCVYPMYDWAHGLEDSFEGITHSLCTLEFEAHRPLYDWFIDRINEVKRSKGQAEIHHAQQIEFSRLAPSYTVMSKRRLKLLVEEGHVAGWDDPRMSTIAGYRRRGYTPEAFAAFIEDVGVTKFNALIDIGRLENAIRDDLNKRAPRRMAVLDPIRVVIENWGEYGDENRVEWFDAVNNPEDASAGTRLVPFSRELFIEREDFMLDPPKKFFRLGPGREVRLRYAYWIACREAVTDDAGNVVELRCTYDPRTRGGESPPADADGNVRKVKGTLHWVSAAHAVEAEVRLYDRLFEREIPDRVPKDAPEGWSFVESLNAESLKKVSGVKLEPNWETGVAWGDGIERMQFERLGYFCVDRGESDEAGRPVFNRTATLKDSWAKASGQAG